MGVGCRAGPWLSNAWVGGGCRMQGWAMGVGCRGGPWM